MGEPPGRHDGPGQTRCQGRGGVRAGGRCRPQDCGEGSKVSKRAGQISGVKGQGSGGTRGGRRVTRRVLADGPEAGSVRTAAPVRSGSRACAPGSGSLTGPFAFPFGLVGASVSPRMLMAASAPPPPPPFAQPRSGTRRHEPAAHRPPRVTGQRRLSEPRVLAAGAGVGGRPVSQGSPSRAGRDSRRHRDAFRWNVQRV